MRENKAHLPSLLLKEAQSPGLGLHNCLHLLQKIIKDRETEALVCTKLLSQTFAKSLTEENNC